MPETRPWPVGLRVCKLFRPGAASHEYVGFIIGGDAENAVVLERRALGSEIHIVPWHMLGRMPEGPA